MLPSDFLEKYEAELGFIVLQNPDNRMGLDGIKARLAHIVGIDGLTVEHGNAGAEIYRLRDQVVEIPAGNAGIRSRVQIIANGLANPSEKAIARVDNAVAAIQKPLEIPKAETKPMTTIAEQLKAARAQLADARQGAANAVAESASASGAVLTEVNKVLKEAGDLRAEVAELTNGGPA